MLCTERKGCTSEIIIKISKKIFIIKFCANILRCGSFTGLKKIKTLMLSYEFTSYPFCMHGYTIIIFFMTKYLRRNVCDVLFESLLAECFVKGLHQKYCR